MFAAIALLLGSGRIADADVFPVNSTADNADLTPGDGTCDIGLGLGICTLRAAIEEANAHANPADERDRIEFLIGVAPPGIPGPHVIAPAADLPQITEAVVIDGYSHPDASRNTATVGFDADLQIELDGSNGARFFGLDVAAPDVEIAGLVVRGFLVGIELNEDFGDPQPRSGRIEGCRIEGNVSAGINADSGGNVIGGGVPSTRNIIAGNGNADVQLSFSGANIVNGNYLGTNPAGTAAHPNPAGTGIVDGATGSIIVNNLVSGYSTFPGIGIELLGLDGTVRGNRVGTNAGGNAVIGNEFGISASGTGYAIGGPGFFDPNVVGGSVQAGIRLGSNNRVEGNYIGTGTSGTTDLGNIGPGVEVRGSDNTIGGASNTGNVIKFNDSGGVVVAHQNNSPDFVRNAILYNAMHQNGATFFPGIDLVTPLDTEVTANDPGDGDEGANRAQNFPVLLDIQADPGDTHIEGELDSAPGTYTLQFFASTVCHQTGHGEGEFFLGQGPVVIPDPPPNDPVGFAFDFPVTAPAPSFAATATDADGNTSEWSLCVFTAGQVGADVRVTKTVLGSPVADPGDTVVYELVVTNAGPLQAVDVVVEDVLPPGLDFVSADPVETSFDAATNTVSWDLDNLIAGGGATLTLTTTVGAAAIGGPDAVCGETYASVVTNQVQLDVAQLDPNPANDTATADLAVRTGADVSIAHVPGSVGADPGETASFDLMVTNTGPDDAASVSAFGSVAGLDCAQAPALTTCDPATGAWTWDIGALADGAAQSVRFDVIAAGDLGDRVLSSATVVSTDDPICMNNTNTGAVAIGGVADIQITGSSYSDTSKRWTVYFRNNGPATVDGLLVDASAPSGIANFDCGGVINDADSCELSPSVESGETGAMTVILVSELEVAQVELSPQALVSPPGLDRFPLYDPVENNSIVLSFVPGRSCTVASPLPLLLLLLWAVPRIRRERRT